MNNPSTNFRRVFFKALISFGALGISLVPVDQPGTLLAAQRIAKRGRWFAPFPPGVRVERATLPGITGEWLTPSHAPTDAVILFFNGGGWGFGYDGLHRHLLARIVQAAKLRAYAVNYRLTPTHLYPIALTDALAAYEGLIAQGVAPHRIALVGISAGGNLAVTLALHLIQLGKPLPGAIAAMSGVFDLTLSSNTFRTVSDPLLNSRFVPNLLKFYVGQHDPQLPLISPVFASDSDLAQLPPLLLQVGEREKFLDDSLQLAGRIKSAQPVTLKVWKGMWHGWQLFAPYMPDAQPALAEVANFVQTTLTPPSA